MDKYKFLLEGIEVSNPNGWDKFELRLKRDDDIAGLLISSTNKFTFKGDGYDIIKDRFDNNYNDKINATIEVLEDNSYVEKYKGVIILTDVLFNLEKRTAQTTIEDASFQGAIQANKNVKAFLDSGMSKNGEQVTTIQLYNLNYFIANGTYFSAPALADRKAYLLKDALDFMVRFMTDDTVKGIQSDYLDDTNNFDGYLPYITTGEAIRLANSDAPNVSFSELITFLNRTHDLTFDFVTVSGEIVMRIEERAFFFQSDVTDTFRDLTDLTLNVDGQKIASHLEVGNNTTTSSGNCSLTARFFSFQEEDYALKGKGNVDKLIDLKTDFVTDSNVIQYIVTNFSNDEFDDNIVIVQAAYHQVAEPKYRAAKFTNTNYCSNDPYYNANFTNDKIIDRSIGAIPNSITKYLGAASTPAKAGMNNSVILNTYSTGLWGQPTDILIDVIRYVNPLELDREFYDLGGNYDANLPDTFYAIPFAGKFSFKASVYTIFKLFEVWHSTSFVTSVSYTIEIRRWNNAMTQLKESVSSPPVTFGFTSLYQSKFFIRTATATMDCDNNDRINVLVKLVLHAGTINVKSILTTIVNSPSHTYLQCLGAEDDAGTYKVFDPNSFKARLYKFRKNVSLQRSDNIRENTRSSFIINELSDTTLDKTVWIEEVVNNVETGETSFTMIN